MQQRFVVTTVFVRNNNNNLSFLQSFHVCTEKNKFILYYEIYTMMCSSSHEKIEYILTVDLFIKTLIQLSSKKEFEF